MHGQHGGDKDPGMEAGGVKSGQGLEAGGDGRGLGLQDMPDPVVVSGNGKTHGNIRRTLEDIQITGDQRRAGEDIDAPAMFPQEFQTTPGQAVAGFHGLIGIADAGQEGPAGLFFTAQFGAQNVQEIDLHLHKTAPG